MMIALGNYVVSPGLSGDGLGRVTGMCGFLFPFNRTKREMCRAKDAVAKEVRQERKEVRQERKEERRSGGGASEGAGPSGKAEWLPIAIGGIVVVGLAWWILRRKKAVT